MTGFGKEGKGQIGYQRATTDLATLASADVLSVSTAVAITEDFRITKIDYFVSWKGVADEDQVIFGFADAELTDAEIEECIEAAPLDRNDHVNLERSHRPVWPLEILMSDNSDGGKKVCKGSFSPKWTFSNADGWKFWVYNPAAGALTTGSSITLFYKWFGVWVT